MSYLQEWMGKKQKLGDGRINTEENIWNGNCIAENKRKQNIKTVLK